MIRPGHPVVFNRWTAELMALFTRKCVLQAAADNPARSFAAGLQYRSQIGLTTSIRHP